MSCLFWLAAPSNQKEVGGAWNCADGGWCRQSWAAIAPIKAIIFFNFPSDVLSYHHYYESHIKVNVPRSIFPVASPHITNICSTGVSGHAHRLMPGFLEVKCVCKCNSYTDPSSRNETKKLFWLPSFLVGTLCIMWRAVRILSTISDAKRGLCYCASCSTLEEHWSQVYLHILKPGITNIPQYLKLWSCLIWASCTLNYNTVKLLDELNWIWHCF